MFWSLVLDLYDVIDMVLLFLNSVIVGVVIDIWLVVCVLKGIFNIFWLFGLMCLIM